ncbi:DUF934 domain-containing protein [Endozoicomonas montiporae]|uniref:Oxidoreductase n=1 Tax=Endozoicomonas montiporae CL-33 TaxID=570277 RepID=A0A142BD30_9GAMM|nr:DUF934 domain-containing protein [Endozoicomonas montiporae]AMO56656.1 hypothetical protein EZMO1_2580 [Endozoicomonas montiporae CL-33]
MDRKLLKDGELHEHQSVVWQSDLILTNEHREALVPRSLLKIEMQKEWQADKQRLDLAGLRKLLYIFPDDDLSDIESELDQFDGIAIDFTVFLDGRGFSHARYLREHCGYQGEIRAVGDVLVDQLFFMQRCGFSSFLLKADQNTDAAFKALSSFSLSYQNASDSRKALYLEREACQVLA